MAGEPRRRLLDVLLSDPPTAEPAIAALAWSASWRLPRRVAAVALADWVRNVPGPPLSLPTDVLTGLDRAVACLLVPDPDGPGRAGLLDAALRAWTAGAPVAGCLAAVGPVVPLARACGSLRWARRALALARSGAVASANGIVRCDENIGTLVLLADAELAGLLTRQALAPLRGLRPYQADRLAGTLLAWLESERNAATAARLLHVHPQTVRYRLRQITELFGDALNDPDARFNLRMALRVRQLLG